MKKVYRSFLVINTFGIGDVLFSTPLLRNLRNYFPASKIYYLCNKKTAPLLKGHPLIEKIFVYERDEFVSQWKRSWWAGFIRYFKFIKEIHDEKIDASIDLSLNTPFSFYAWAAGVKNRFGLDYKNRGVFLTKKLKIEGFDNKHVVEYYLDTLKLIGVKPVLCPMEVYTDLESEILKNELFKKYALNETDILIGIVPAGGDSWGMDAALKQWGQDKFISLIEMIGQEKKGKIIIFGSSSEKFICDHIESSARCKTINTAGKLDLKQLVALFKKCSIVICNNAGPLHIAVALKVKTVCINGPVNEKVYGQFPLNENNLVVKKDLSCRPCYRKFRIPPCNKNGRCLTDITPQDVLDTVNRLI